MGLMLLPTLKPCIHGNVILDVSCKRINLLSKMKSANAIKLWVQFTAHCLCLPRFFKIKV